MVCIDVSIHRLGISGEQEGIVGEAVEGTEMIKQIAAVFEVRWDEPFQLLEMVVDPFAKAVEEGACTTYNGPELVRRFVDFKGHSKARESVRRKPLFF
jgi:hypothetical protein